MPEVEETEVIEGELVTEAKFGDVAKFNPIISEIKTAKTYLSLSIVDIADKEGYEKVKTAHIHVKKLIADSKKTKDAMGEEAKAFLKNVSTIQDNIESELIPVRDYLDSERDRIDTEKERIKQQKELEEQIRYDSRLKKILSIGFEFNGALYQFRDHAINMQMLKTNSDEEFISFIKMAEHDWNYEQARIAEDVRLKAEKEAQEAKEKAEREAQAQETARKEKEALDAEKARLKAIQEEQDRQATELEKEKAEFAKMKAEMLAKQVQSSPPTINPTVVSVDDLILNPIPITYTDKNGDQQTAIIDTSAMIEKAIDTVFGEEKLESDCYNVSVSVGEEFEMINGKLASVPENPFIETIHILVDHKDFVNIKNKSYRFLNLIDSENGDILKLN